MNRFILPMASLWKREIVHFFRQRNRVVAALSTPLFIWFLVGSGFRGSFRLEGVEGMSYLEYFYPGVIALVVLFTSIFSAMSLIEDRRDGFLQGVLVAPVPRPAIVMGKILGGTSQGFLQGVLLLVIAPFLGVPLTWMGAVRLSGALILLSFVLSAFGFLMAWRMDSISGYHAIMNFLLMPMWLLSGALFPMTGVPGWLHLLMQVNPLTYGVTALRASFYHGTAASSVMGASFLISMVVMLGFGVAIFVAAVVRAHRRVPVA